MKTLKTILLFGIIAGVTVFTSCEEDDDTNTLSKEDAETTIESSSKSMKTTMAEMDSTKGMKSMNMLLALNKVNNPFESPVKSLRNPILIENIKQVVNTDQLNNQKIGDNQFVLSDHAGTYTWQSDSTWKKDLGNPGDEIIIEYPTNPANYGQTGNNAVLTISGYKEKEMNTDSGKKWVPVTVKANLKVNGTKYMEIDHSITTDAEGNPAGLNMELTMKPFTYKLSLDKSSMTITYSLSKEKEGTLFSGDLSLTYMSSEMENLKKVDFNSMQFGNLDYQGWIKPYALTSNSTYENATYDAGDILDAMNNQMDMKVYKFDSGEKVANLVFHKNAGTDYPLNKYLDNLDIPNSFTVAFEFKDGTTKDAGPYFAKIISKIKNMKNKINEFYGNN
jgi:hypothetical protein